MKVALFVLLILLGGQCFAQENLVKNQSFEDYSLCPSGADQIFYANYWTNLDTNYTGYDTGRNKFSMGYPEYINKCANGNPSTQIHVGTPSNGHFYQFPRSGSGMAQVMMFTDESDPPPFLYYKRDYLQGKLNRKLKAGKSYCIEFYVNLEEASGYAIQDIGAYLDNGLIDTATFRWMGEPQSQWQPQVSNHAGILSDTAAWVRIQGSFTAKGNEQFITIGNFRDLAHTTYTPVPLNHYNNGVNNSWYLIDDVSVIESDLPAFAGNDRHIGLGDSTYIGRPQEVGLECTWAKLGSSTVIGTGGGIWVKPTTTTSYVVTQTLCGNVKRDTVLVEVWPLGLSSVKGQTQDYNLAPNPSHGQVNLLQNVSNDEEIQVAVYNLVGQEVYRSSLVFANGQAELQLPELAKGIYFLRLQNKNGTVWNKRLVRE